MTTAPKTKNKKDNQNTSHNECHFCLRRDPEFNDESIDIHLFKECPMLTACWECEQIVEVRIIEEHLLEECSSMHKYQFHSKCKQVIMTDEMDSHVCERLEPNGAVRCPLCTFAVYPNTEDGWRDHILNKACAGNPRL